jgi:ankyrin repeat protein
MRISKFLIIMIIFEKEGNTPFHVAWSRAIIPVVALLLEKGANINEKNKV